MRFAYWEASGFNAAQIGFAIVNGAQNDDLRTVDKGGLCGSICKHSILRELE